MRKLSFTGSTEVGRTLMEQCAPTIKKLSLELGGNAPFIVFDDADLDRAVDGILASKFRNAGQTCVCANRIYIQAGVYEEVTKRLVAKVQAMKVGDGFGEGVTQGPLIDANAVEKVQEHIADATAHGAKVIVGGKHHALGGTFFEPTVVRDVTKSMRFATEETFGPVAPLFRFETEQEVIEQANDTIFGLAAYFFTRDYARVWRVSEALEYGIVGINTGLISNEVGPFGGVKQSGLGREGSKYGIEEYLEIKYLCLDLVKAKPWSAWRFGANGFTRFDVYERDSAVGKACGEGSRVLADGAVSWAGAINTPIRAEEARAPHPASMPTMLVFSIIRAHGPVHLILSGHAQRDGAFRATS